MARSATSPLAESLEFLQRQVKTRNMQADAYKSAHPWPAERTKRSRSGQSGITRVKLEKAIPECVGHGRRTQGQPGMARFGLLHHVHRQETERVDAQLIQLGGSQGGHVIRPIYRLGQAIHENREYSSPLRYIGLGGNQVLDPLTAAYEEDICDAHFQPSASFV